MPLLDIAIAQPSLQNHLPPLRPQNPLSAKLFYAQFAFADDNSLSFAWKQFRFPENVDFNGGRLQTQRAKLLIKAVATLVPHSSLHKEDGCRGYKNSQIAVNPPNPTIRVESPTEDSVELDEREKLRRMRISKANKGNTPWNKGRKHSAETLQRIRERTRLAMQNPKIRQKLANLGHAQSEETRIKIGVGVRMGWQRRREQMMVQETCYYDWQNLVAEASRRGFAGEDELHWDSYQILSEQLEQEWLESVEQRKSMPRPKGSKRAPKSLEQRRKIAEAIAAKWADPDYRDRVCSGLAKYHGTPVGAERRLRRRPSGAAQTKRREPTVKKACEAYVSSKSENKSQHERLKLRRSNTPRYKDPLVSFKLEMIKNIRAQRAVAEMKKTEAIERARLLIAEAEKAAKVLEVAAMKSPIAQASLVETRKLIAEAIESIESIKAMQAMSDENDRFLSIASTEQDRPAEEGTVKGNGGYSDINLLEVNGTQTQASSKDEGFDLACFSLQDILNGDWELLSTSPSRFGLSSLDFVIPSGSVEQLKPNGNVNCKKKFQLNAAKVQPMKEETPSKPITSTKRWVRGKLVEVAEGE